MRRACLALLLLAACAHLTAAERTQATAPRPQWEGLAGLDIIPCPKRIRLTGERLVLAQSGTAQAVIVVPDQAHPTARIAAGEINDRTRALAQVELPVQTLAEYRREPAARSAIAIDLPQLSRFATSLKHKQGYEIRTPAGPAPAAHIAGVSGVDAQGALYGCVTLRSLIVLDADRVVLRGAQVQDWPDFRRRGSDGLSISDHMFGLGRWTRDMALRRGKECIDWALRHKLNYVRAQLPAGVSPPEPGKAAEATKMYAELCRYANARAIRVIFMTHAKIGTVARHASDPRLQGVPKFRDYFFCWSRDALIEESASGVTEFAREVGPQTFFFHFPDIHENNWTKRCDQCRERFGDDRARADANVINILARGVREGDPQATSLFALQPYLMNFDLPQNEKWERYYARLSSMIPDEGVYLCQRECSDMEARSWRRVVRQPIFYYHEPQAFIPRRPFSTATRFAKTFYFDDDRDIYFSPVPWTTLPMFMVQELTTAEYSWNTHAPGSEMILHDPSGVDWSGRPEDYCRERRRVGPMDYREWLWREGGSEPPEVGRDLLTRACRVVYGPDIAAAMAAGHRSGITTEREYWAGPARLGLEVRAAIAAKHCEGARAACAALDPLYARHKEIDERTRLIYLRLLKLNHVYGPIARVQQHLLAGQNLIAQPHTEPGEVMEHVAAGRRAMEQARQELAQAFAKFSLDKVSDNYRLRCGGLKDALASIEGFRGAFDLIDQQLRPAGPGVGVLMSCTFDPGDAGAESLRQAAGGVRIVPDGKVGQAALFPTSAKLTFPVQGQLDPARGTVEMWVKPNWHWNDNRIHTFLSVRAADEGWRKNRMSLAKNVNYSLNFSVAGAHGGRCIAAVRPSVFRKDRWIHLAASWDCRHGVRLFVDGALAAQGKGQWSTEGLSAMWIGCDPTGDRGADAVLDEVRVLSAARGFED